MLPNQNRPLVNEIPVTAEISDNIDAEREKTNIDVILFDSDS